MIFSEKKLIEVARTECDKLAYFREQIKEMTVELVGPQEEQEDWERLGMQPTAADGTLKFYLQLFKWRNAQISFNLDQLKKQL